uniref:Uncharacterized protein n=1 Tax=Lygus hesperus TaxID=30085 RepID=A0A0K8SRR0_LYGHE
MRSVTPNMVRGTKVDILTGTADLLSVTDASGGLQKSVGAKLTSPHMGEFEYDVVQDLHGSWHGSSHPDGYGGRGDDSGSYRFGGHFKVIGAPPQGRGRGLWGRSKRSAKGGWSKTSVSRPHSDKYSYDDEHEYHGG